MNPRYAAPTRSVPKPRADALFAAEVYADEEESPVPKRGAVDELAQLRTELRGEARALRLAISRPAKVPAELLAELMTLRATVDEFVSAPKRRDTATTVIRGRGIEGPTAAALARVAKRTELGNGASVIEKLRAACAELVTVGPPTLPTVRPGRSIVALVGPAGVGKTTTAAKLAAHARMARKTVALVSCDNFRVGAMDQLAKYADLMEARFHTAMSPEELAEIVRRETADVIIIDTSGRPIEAEATEALLGAPELRSERLGRRVEVLLCVAASLRAADATRVRRDFARAEPTGLVITKLDETEAPAGIAHAAFTTQLPLSTVCAGQCVPEDIAPATTELVVDALFPQTAAKKARIR